MPELPEVETIRRELRKKIVGRTIESVEVRLPKMVFVGPATVSNIRKGSSATVSKFRKSLTGKKVVSVKRRAKMLLLDLFGGGTVLIHLKMTGQLIFAAKGARKAVKLFNSPSARKLELPHKHTHAVFKFRDGSRLFFNDLRQFGYLRFVRSNELSKVAELKRCGPEPLSRDFTLAYWQAKLKSRPKTTIKQLLMDSQAVAGIGNIYSDEILYRARIRPTRKVSSLSRAESRVLFGCITEILLSALCHHGSSVGDYFRVDGSEGEYGRRHRVYARAGEKCKECRATIKSVKLGGRTSSFCPKCQK